MTIFQRLLILCTLLPCTLQAQVVNGYAKVTAISGATLTLGTYNETGAPFVIGKQVIVMQMQDDVIGTNTADNANFGNLSSIQQAGLFEVRNITNVSRDAFGAPIGITLHMPLGVSFNTGANSSVQVITYELLGGGGNFSTTGNMAALPWNGSIGGVIALQVNGTLTIAHRITADAAGFKGGAKDPWDYTTPCNATTYRASSVAANTNEFATKGESIYKLTNTAWADGRGKILNGGGGGNMINAGGGGGGNFSAGGASLRAWSCAVAAGGFGGLDLSAYINASRVFMGGGGGGGEGNDNVSTDGGNGGGIVLLKANAIQTVGSCSGLRISANGATAANSGNDGAGGGGAAGSIVLQCPIYAFASGCPIVISANGGNGGTVNSTTHSGGGGGGQGTVIFSGSVPTGNVTAQTLNGVGGCDDSGCASRAASGGGANGRGVLSGSSGVLPIRLLDFKAVPDQWKVNVFWTTATEHDNEHFTVERSTDNEDWNGVAELPGAGNSQSLQQYATVDEHPLMGISYYRLRQIDTDGNSTLSNTVSVEFNGGSAGIQVFPNPTTGNITLVHEPELGAADVQIWNGMGQRIDVRMIRVPGRCELDLSEQVPGVYVLHISTAYRTWKECVMVQR